MERFQPGTICFHKATELKCVVISTTDKMVKVRDANNVEQDYYPVELETEAEVEARYAAQAAVQNKANEERDLGFGY